MPERDRSLEALHARAGALADALADDGDRNSARWAAHVAVLDRPAAMRRGAESAGWTSLAIEHDGAAERFRLFRVPPGRALRVEVPDPFNDRPRDPEP
jgi:hypothetical protein